MSQIEVEVNWIKERILNPNMFDYRGFRRKRKGKHILNFGCPLGKYDSNKNICKDSVKLQSIWHPASEFKKKCYHGKCIIRRSRFSKLQRL